MVEEECSGEMGYLERLRLGIYRLGISVILRNRSGEHYCKEDIYFKTEPTLDHIRFAYAVQSDTSLMDGFPADEA